jgi:hypothetical protein
VQRCATARNSKWCGSSAAADISRRRWRHFEIEICQQICHAKETLLTHP